MGGYWVSAHFFHIILWGLVKFHTGGIARERIHVRRTGEIPVPTV